MSAVILLGMLETKNASLHVSIHRQRERQAGRQADRKADRQEGGQMDGQTNRQTEGVDRAHLIYVVAGAASAPGFDEKQVNNYSV